MLLGGGRRFMPAVRRLQEAATAAAAASSFTVSPPSAALLQHAAAWHSHHGQWPAGGTCGSCPAASGTSVPAALPSSTLLQPQLPPLQMAAPLLRGGRARGRAVASAFLEELPSFAIRAPEGPVAEKLAVSPKSLKTMASLQSGELADDQIKILEQEALGPHHETTGGGFTGKHGGVQDKGVGGIPHIPIPAQGVNKFSIGSETTNGETRSLLPPPRNYVGLPNGPIPALHGSDKEKMQQTNDMLLEARSGPDGMKKVLNKLPEDQTRGLL